MSNKLKSSTMKSQSLKNKKKKKDSFTLWLTKHSFCSRSIPCYLHFCGVFYASQGTREQLVKKEESNKYGNIVIKVLLLKNYEIRRMSLVLEVIRMAVSFSSRFWFFVTGLKVSLAECFPGCSLRPFVSRKSEWFLFQCTKHCFIAINVSTVMVVLWRQFS